MNARLEKEAIFTRLIWNWTEQAGPVGMSDQGLLSDSDAIKLHFISITKSLQKDTEKYHWKSNLTISTQ